MLSIITPVYNGAEFLRENIESILKLDTEHEHIVVDGGSTDGTLDIVAEYPHLIVLHQTEMTGMYGAIDMGFRVAKGEYICWVNCDDRVVPEGYKKMYDYAVAKRLDFVCSDGIFDYVHENRKGLVKGTHFAKYLLKRGLFPFSQPSVIYNHALYLKVGGLDYLNFRICGDGDLFWRFACVEESHFGYIKTVSSIFLKHGNSLGDKNTAKGREEQARSNRPHPNISDMLTQKVVKLLNL